jgi:hypothetical protein
MVVRMTDAETYELERRIARQLAAALELGPEEGAGTPETRATAEVGDAAAQLRREIAAIRRELTAEMARLRTELSSDILRLESKVGGDRPA